jgi:hypothetical protein
VGDSNLVHERKVIEIIETGEDVHRFAERREYAVCGGIGVEAATTVSTITDVPSPSPLTHRRGSDKLLARVPRLWKRCMCSAKS